MGTRITQPLKNVVLSYPHLFVARAAVPGGDKKFSASFRLDTKSEEGKALIKQLKGAIQQIADADFGGKLPSRLSLKEDKTDDRYLIVSAYSTSRPVVVDNKLRPLEETSGGQNDLLFPGTIVNANVNAYGYTAGGNGIAFGLEGVQWVGGGERLGDAPAAGSMFEEAEGEDPNVTGFEDTPIKSEEAAFDW
jgi:hypothetical protein